MTEAKELSDAGGVYEKELRRIFKKFYPGRSVDLEDTYLVDRRIVALSAAVTYNFAPESHETVMKLVGKRLQLAWIEKAKLIAQGIGPKKWRQDNEPHP